MSAPAERGIIFSDPMIKAIRSGQKSQTRRLLTPAYIRFFEPDSRPKFRRPSAVELQRAFLNASNIRQIMSDSLVWEADAFPWQAPAERTHFQARHDPAIGARLYVREGLVKLGDGVGYAADGARARGADWTWKPNGLPARYCPRALSRSAIVITAFRVQHLHEITEEDIIAEGAPLDPTHRDTTADGSNPFMCVGDRPWVSQSPRAWYHRLWDSLHHKPGERWEDNPWIVAQTFTTELKK